MLLQLFREDLCFFRYIYLKFGKTEIISAYEYQVAGGRKFGLQIFNKKVTEFIRVWVLTYKY